MDLKPDKENKENKENKEPKVVLQVLMNPDGSCEMKTSLLPPMVIYLFEEMKFNLLNQKNQKPTLFKPNTFMNDLRNRFRK